MTQKLDRKNFMFTEKQNEVLIKKPGELLGKNFKIKNLKNCKCFILDYTTGMFIDNCEDTTFIIGPCNGSIFIRTSMNCEVSIISKQLRFRDCENMTIYSYCQSEPVIENCFGFKFGPFNYNFPQLDILFEKSDIEKSASKYNKIYDFCYKEGEEHYHSINKKLFVYKYLNLKEYNLENLGNNKSIYADYTSELIVDGYNIIDENYNVKSNETDIRLNNVELNEHKINNYNINKNNNNNDNTALINKIEDISTTISKIEDNLLFSNLLECDTEVNNNNKLNNDDISNKGK